MSEYIGDLKLPEGTDDDIDPGYIWELANQDEKLHGDHSIGEYQAFIRGVKAGEKINEEELLRLHNENARLRDLIRRMKMSVSKEDEK